MSECNPIHKEDPYKDDRVDTDEESTYTWYYLRDVWEKCIDIYGTEIADLWVCIIFDPYNLAILCL